MTFERAQNVLKAFVRSFVQPVAALEHLCIQAMENTKTNGKPGFIKPDLITRFLQGVNGVSMRVEVGSVDRHERFGFSRLVWS